MCNSSPEVLLLSADFGTQGVRAAVFDKYGNPVQIAFEEYDTYYPQPGWAEQDPHQWWEAFKKALSKCLIHIKDPSKIKGMTICSTSSTVLAVDAVGEPLIPAILWMDNRAVAETEKINRSAHPYLKYSGGEDSVEWMIPKLLWLKENKPEIYNKAYLILEEQDWLNYRLTNRWVSSKCTATCKWNYVDIEQGWSDEFMCSIGLGDYKSKLPIDVVAVGKPIGRIAASAAEELGLNTDITVFQGGIDAHIGMLGMGVVEPGDLGIIMGTSFVHLTHSPNPVFHKGLWGPYPNALIDGLWLLEGGQVSCGSLTRWFRDHLAKDLTVSTSKDNAYQLLAAEAAKVPPGSEGLIVLDTWQGNRTPYRNPLAKGAIWGMTLSHSRAHLYRAILESVAYGTRNILDCFAKVNIEIKRIIACGGVLNNNLWLQIIANVTGIPIQKVSFGEAGVLGCAVCTAAGLGIYTDLTQAAKNMVTHGEVIEVDQSEHELYSHYFEMYKKTYELLEPQMLQLNKVMQKQR